MRQANKILELQKELTKSPIHVFQLSFKGQTVSKMDPGRPVALIFFSLVAFPPGPNSKNARIGIVGRVIPKYLDN